MMHGQPHISFVVSFDYFLYLVNIRLFDHYCRANACICICFNIFKKSDGIMTRGMSVVTLVTNQLTSVIQLYRIPCQKFSTPASYSGAMGGGGSRFSNVNAETILSHAYLVIILILSNILVGQFNIKHKIFQCG